MEFITRSDSVLSKLASVDVGALGAVGVVPRAETSPELVERGQGIDRTAGTLRALAWSPSGICRLPEREVHQGKWDCRQLAGTPQSAPATLTAA
jgi:hypothetical protein